MGSSVMGQSEDLSCAQLVELVSDYVEGALSRVEQARVEDHLAQCGGCSIYFDQLRAAIELTGRLRTEDVPDEAAAVLLAAFRDWNVSPPEAVTAGGVARQREHESNRRTSRTARFDPSP